uniref:mitogen-activated protein kinase kinase n=1 Tax=Acrobeloides nanus TaxID=290746 RepID=A0A914D1M7_9BILA
MIYKQFRMQKSALDEKISIRIHNQDQEYDFNFDTLYKIKVLGQGQSIVAKYLHEPSNKFIAIKSIIVPRSRYRGINIESLCSIIEEIEILKILEHSEYVINYYGCGYDGDFLHLCLESMDESLQGLYKKMSDIPGFNYGHGILLENVAIAITNALVDCERNKIAHCDIKPGNILINASGQIKLSDFGEACILHRLKGPKGGTIFYWPPEKLAYGDADTQYEVGDYSQADVWALGMTLIECIYHSNPILMESHATGIEDFANIQKYILELDVDEFTGSKKDDFDMGGLLPSDSFPKLFVGSKMAKFIRRCLSRVPIRPKFNELLITQEYRDLIINPPFVSDFLIKVKKWFIQYYEIRTGDIKFPDDDRIYEFNLNDFEDKTPKYFEFHFHYREPLNSVKLLSQPQERYLHKPSNKELYFKRNVYTGHLNYNFYDEVQFLREFNDHTNIIKMYSNGFFSDFNGNEIVS